MNSDTSGWTITRCQVLEENDKHNMAVSSPTVPPTNKRKQWQVQFPLDVNADANITIKSIKEDRIPDQCLCLCPEWTAGGKSGRPKNGERVKSRLETAW
jgi:hypothetical protein